MLESHFTVGLLHPHKRRVRHKVADLTKAEVGVLEALDRAIRQYANPSLREISECSDTIRSASAIHKYLHKLAAKGYVKVNPRQARGARLLRPLPPRPA